MQAFLSGEVKGQSVSTPSPRGGGLGWGRCMAMNQYVGYLLPAARARWSQTSTRGVSQLYGLSECRAGRRR